MYGVTVAALALAASDRLLPAEILNRQGEAAGQDEEKGQQGLTWPRHAGNRCNTIGNHGVGTTRNRVAGIRCADVLVVAVKGRYCRLADTGHTHLSAVANIVVQAGDAVEYHVRGATRIRPRAELLEVAASRGAAANRVRGLQGIGRAIGCGTCTGLFRIADARGGPADGQGRFESIGRAAGALPAVPLSW